MEEATYYMCCACGYEFLTKGKSPTCPRCKGNRLEAKDIGTIAGLDE